MTLHLPAFEAPFAAAVVHAIHVQEGGFVATGGALFDIAIDFSGGVAFDCAPISTYRIISREDVWVHRLDVAQGDAVAPDVRLALLASDRDDPATAPPLREARVALASILRQDDWWTSAT